MTENTLGVGLNKLAAEGSHEGSFLAVFEDKFTADVRKDLSASATPMTALASHVMCANHLPIKSTTCSVYECRC